MYRIVLPIKKQKNKEEKNKENKEGRKTIRRERERERKGEGGKLGRNQGRHSENKHKCPVFRGKQFSLFYKEKRKQMKQNKNKQDTEGLGPSEVALWDTSPNP